jgi:hypothetical protein
VAVRTCTIVIDHSTGTESTAIALVGAEGQQRIVASKRLWTDADVAQALQEAAGKYGVPIAVDRPIAAQPVQATGQVRPRRRIVEEPER